MSGLAPITPEQQAKTDALVQSLIAGCIALREQENVKSSDELETDCTHMGCPDNLVVEGATAPQHESGDSAYRQVMIVRTECPSNRPGEGELRPPFDPPAPDCPDTSRPDNAGCSAESQALIVRTMSGQSTTCASADCPDKAEQSSIDSGAKRTESIEIRLTPKEKSALKIAAGGRSMSDLIREKILGLKPARNVKKDLAERQLRNAFGAIENNLNQIARRMNTKNKVGEVVDVLATLAVLQEIRDLIKNKFRETVGEEIISTQIEE